MQLNRMVAEFIGTFALVFLGVGAIAVNGMMDGSVGLLGIALAHGLALVTFVSALGPVSGGHFNPAVTIGVWSVGKIDAVGMAGYIVSQLLAGFVAVILLKMVFPISVLDGVKMGTPLVNTDAGITVLGALLTEIILTFFLMSVIYGTAVDKRAPKMGGLFIGLAVTMDILMGGPVSGAAMNPARHLGPAVLGGYTENLWIYWVGPIAGALFAAQLHKNVLETA